MLYVNKVIYNRQGKIIILGAMTWLCYIVNNLIMRHVIKRLNCNIIHYIEFLTIHVYHRIKCNKSFYDIQSETVLHLQLQ